MDTVKEQIVYYCNERLTAEEFNKLKNFAGFDECEYDSLEEFRDQFNFDNIERLIREDVANTQTFNDLTLELNYYSDLIRIIQKAFHQKDALIKQLRECLTPEEFKLVTEFTAIHTGDNDIELIDDNCCGYYSSLEEFNNWLKDMFIDICSQLESDDLKTEFYQHWVRTISIAYCKIYYYSHKLKKGIPPKGE